MDADYDGVIGWPLIRTYLNHELQQVQRGMETAVGEEMYRLQGESRRLRKLLNLPSALTLLEEGT